MQEWHGARDTGVRDKRRAVCYKKPGKDGLLGRDVRRNWKAAMA
jgi:hypothetical protein